MADLSSFQNRRRLGIAARRSAFTLAFLSCLVVRQILLWSGAVKADDSLGTLIMNQLHWFLVAIFIGGISGACLGYYLMARWIKNKAA